jgi:hypothetical protein
MLGHVRQELNRTATNLNEWISAHDQDAHTFVMPNQRPLLERSDGNEYWGGVNGGLGEVGKHVPLTENS